MVSEEFQNGSFGLELIAIQSVTNQIASLFSGTAKLVSIVGALGFGGGGLRGLIKILRGRRPGLVKVIGDKTNIKVMDNHETETIKINLTTGKLYSKRVIRQPLAKVIRPLFHSGIDEFYSSIDGKPFEQFEGKADVESFDLEASEANIVSDVVIENVLLQIDSAVFKVGNKWKFNDGGLSFSH